VTTQMHSTPIEFVRGDATGLRIPAQWRGAAGVWPGFTDRGVPSFWIAVRRQSQSDPKLIALCHWNANIDNAWFWRDEASVLRCGQTHDLGANLDRLLARQRQVPCSANTMMLPAGSV